VHEALLAEIYQVQSAIGQMTGKQEVNVIVIGRFIASETIADGLDYFQVAEHPETDPDFCDDLLLTEGNQV